jgi:2-polyprenyl-6-methoxyphenol hydroxylase-like FAD-dependent oxidoreductase
VRLHDPRLHELQVAEQPRWSPWIRAIVAATDATQLMRHDVWHLPGGCPSYACGRVAIVGDAAHAMLPTIGQVRPPP